MADIVKNLEWRYAVKKFDSEKTLPENEVLKLKQSFNLTATSYGLQPIKMLVIRNKALQQQLVQHSFGQEQVAQASDVLVICIANNIDEEYINKYFEQVKQVRGTSDDILNPFKEALMSDFSTKDIKEIQKWATNQAYLALGNLLTVCAVEKIDSCPMEGFIPKAYDELLGLDKHGLTSALVLPVGYRAEGDMFSELKKVRRKLAESIIEIT